MFDACGVEAVPNAKGGPTRYSQGESDKVTSKRIDLKIMIIFKDLLFIFSS